MALYCSPEYHSTQGEYDFIRGTFLRNYFEIRPKALEMLFKGFSIFSSVGHFVKQSRTSLGGDVF